MKISPQADDRDFMLLAPSSAVDSSLLSPVEIARVLSAIPSAPAVLVKLASLPRDGSASLSEIGRLVKLDVGLACRVFRAAFESATEDEVPCFTLEDAINKLGSGYIHDLVKQVNRSQALNRPLESYGMEMDEFWRWSVSTALAAEVLAQSTGEDADVAFSLGLLHNAGIFAVEEWVRQESPGLAFAHRGWPREYTSAEVTFLGFTHAEVGAVLLNLWQFPRATTEPIRHQYVPLRFGPHARLTCLLHAAKWLAAAVCSEDGMPPLPDARYLDVLRLPSYELVKLVVEVRVRIGHARQAVCTLAA